MLSILNIHKSLYLPCPVCHGAYEWSRLVPEAHGAQHTAHSARAASRARAQTCAWGRERVLPLQACSRRETASVALAFGWTHILLVPPLVAFFFPGAECLSCALPGIRSLSVHRGTKLPDA